MLKERSKLASRWVSYNVLLGALPAVLVGCGAPAAPVAPAPSASALSAVPIVKEEPADLTPVAAPPELIALARFKKPQTAIETVAAWANFPYKLHDVLPPELKGLESVVAWDAPLEAAVAIDPLGEGKVSQPLAVVSLGLTSLDGALDYARGQGQPVSKVRAGVYRIGDAKGVSCTAGLAIGSAPARLVCGNRSHDVDGLFNYATRGLPNEPLPNVDFQLELRLEPVKKKYQAEIGSARLLAGFLLREVQVDNPRFDRALSDVAYTLIDEATAVVHDLDKVRLDTNLDSAKNLIDVRLGYRFAGQKSWLVQGSSEALATVGPVPDLFWQLPADSTAASFGAGWKPARLKPIGHTLAELLDGYLESEKVPAGLRNQASKTVELLFDQNANLVHAEGELSELPSDPLLAADARFFGWHLAAVEGEPKNLFALFDGLQATLASRDLARLLKTRLKANAAVPKFSAHGVQVRGFKPGAKAYRLDIPRELFDKYATGQLKSDLAAKGKNVAKTAPLTVVIAFDGERSWAGMSPDEKVIIKRLEALKDPKTPVLRGREGLDTLKSKPRAAGGFLTLERFAGKLGALAGRDADAAKLFSALPHHGQTPVLFSSELNASGPEITTTISLPRAAVEDLGALIPVLVLMAGNHDSVLGSP